MRKSGSNGGARVGAAFFSAVCLAAAYSMAAELALWQQYPALQPVAEHVSPLCSQTIRDGRSCDMGDFHNIKWNPLLLQPRTAGLGAVVQTPKKAPHTLTLGIGVTVRHSFETVFRQGNIIAAAPVVAAWDAGAFGAPAFKTLVAVESADPEADADWTHQTLRYSGELDADEAALMDADAEPVLRITVSRLCPGVLFETNTGGLSFFQGLPPYAQTVPVAVKTAAGVKILEVKFDDELVLPDGCEWVLVFWGKIPPQRYNFTWRGDRDVAQDRPPVLLVSSSPAISFSCGEEVALRFAEQDVKAVLFPLFGVDFPRGEETEAWRRELPVAVAKRCDEWAKRLGSFPVTAAETYSYDAASDTVECETRFAYERLHADARPWAPLPPTLMLGHGKLPLKFEPEPAEDVYRTAYGPLAVVDGADSVKWRFTGVARYALARPRVGPSNERSRPLERELERELDKIFAVPYLAPWVYETRRFGPMSEVYWRQPVATAYYLAQTLPVLSEEYRAKLAEYLKNFQSLFPFLEITALPTWKGPKRTRYFTGVDEDGNKVALPDTDYKYYAGMNDPGRITFNVARGLDEYYEATGETPDEATWQRLADLLEESLCGADWASGLWTQGHAPEIPPQARSWKMDIEFPARCLQRHLGCLTGFLRTSARCGKAKSMESALAWGRLARGLATRVALAEYAVWLKPPFGIINYEDPTASVPPGTSTNPDGNSVWVMNQFAVHLQDSSTVVHRKSVYIDYLDMPPEVGRFLHDHAPERPTAFLNAVDRGWPLWWTANMTSELGVDSSAGLQQPMNSHSLFMACAWIRGDAGEKLEKMLDYSWLERGDLYYIHKLAETIKALRGADGGNK